jgi:hypothetical protein
LVDSSNNYVYSNQCVGRAVIWWKSNEVFTF